MADSVRRLRVELDADSTSFSKGFASAAKSADSLSKSLAPVGRGMKAFGDASDSTSQRAGKLADNIGRVSTTLARSADAFGLPTQALRTLDDVADVAELGLNNLTKSAVGFNAASIGVAGAGLAIGTAIGSWLNTFPAVQKAADNLFHSMFRFVGLAGEIDKASTQGIGEFSKRMAASNAEALEKQVASMKAQGASVKEVAKFYGDSLNPALKEKLGLTEKDIEAEKKHEQASHKAAEAAKRLADERARFSEIVKAQTSDKMIEEMANLPGFKTGLGEALKGGLATDINLTTQLGLDQAVPQMQQFAFATQSFEEHIGKAAQEMRDGGASANEIADALMRMGASAEEAEQAIKGTVKQLSLGASLKAGLAAGLKDLPQVILGALQGGGDVGKSIGAHLGGSIGEGIAGPLTKKLSDVLGKTLGGALGSIIPGLGSLLGSQLGGLLSKGLGKLGSALGIGGNKQIMEVNRLRDAFLQAQGGFVELQKKLQGLTNQDLVKKIFNAKTVEEFNAAVAEVNGLLGNQEAATQALKEATDRYGFSLEELGPTLQRQELDAQAGQLLQDFKILTASGIDVNTVIAKMGPSLVDFVNTSKAAGQAIPEAMRPVIDQLIASGQLVDENGEAYKSAEEAGVTFAQTMSEQFTTLIGHIEDLVSALTGVPREVPINIPVTYTTSGAPPGGVIPLPDDVQSFADGGIGNFGSGTLAMLHGLEAIVPLKGGGAASMGRSQVSITQNIKEDPYQSSEGRLALRRRTLQIAQREQDKHLSAQIQAGKA